MRKPAESLASGKVALVPLEPATTSEVRLYLKRNAAHSQAVVSFIGFLPYRHAFGASGPLGFPSFINPAGIDTGFIGLVISGVVAFVLALVAAMVIGTRKDEGGKALNISVD